MITALIFFSCPSGNIRAFLEEFRPYADGTYSLASVRFERNPTDIMDLFLYPAPRGNFSGRYHAALYDTSGKLLSQQFFSSTVARIEFTGLGLGTDYRITVAPWNDQSGLDGKADEYIFRHGYAYANPNAPADGDGLTWQTAIKDLQDAIDLASNNYMLGVRAAIGTYVPSNDPSGLGSVQPEYRHFQLIPGRPIEGGWNPATNERTGYSTATGAQGGGVKSYHVFYYDNAEAIDIAFLRYFNVTGGEADGSDYPHNCGGGLWSSVPKQIQYCNFYGNSATQDGGGFWSSSATQIEGCHFYNNSAGVYGGGIYSSGSMEITSSRLDNNAAQQLGGAIYYNNSAGMNVSRTVFERNTAWTNGGAVNAAVDSPIFLDSDVFYQNEADEGYAVCGQSDITIQNCVFYQDFLLQPKNEECRSVILANGKCNIDHSTFVTKGAKDYVFIKKNIGGSSDHKYTMSVFFEITPKSSNSIQSLDGSQRHYNNVFSTIDDYDTASVHAKSVAANDFKNISNPLQSGDWFSKNCGLMPSVNGVLYKVQTGTLLFDIRGLPRTDPTYAGAYEYEQ